MNSRTAAAPHALTADPDGMERVLPGGWTDAPAHSWDILARVTHLFATLTTTAGELNPLVPHPIEIALLLLALGPVLAVVIYAIVLLTRDRITLWPTFTVSVAFSLLIPCVGLVVGLVVLILRRNERGAPEATASAPPGSVS